MKGLRPELLKQCSEIETCTLSGRVLYTVVMVKPRHKRAMCTQLMAANSGSESVINTRTMACLSYVPTSTMLIECPDDSWPVFNQARAFAACTVNHNVC